MVLLEFLKRNREAARRVFGKRELRIIEKQMLGLTLKQSEKNRLSRDIRKKLMFIREIIKYESEFGLKHGAKINQIIAAAKEEILESKYFPRIQKIIVFGSTVERQRSFRSDIDIAVVFDDINLREATEFRIKTGSSDILDIQVYNILPDKIKKEIDEKGRVIYERKNS